MSFFLEIVGEDLLHLHFSFLLANVERSDYQSFSEKESAQPHSGSFQTAPIINPIVLFKIHSAWQSNKTLLSLASSGSLL